MTVPTLADVEPIGLPFRQITGVDDLRHVVEAPVRAACIALFERNIRTFASSANRTHIDCHEPAWVVIDFAGLSPANQQVALSVCRVGKHRRFARIEVPLPLGLDVAQISQSALAVACMFVLQDRRPLRQLTLDDMRDWLALGYGIDASEWPLARFETLRLQLAP